MSKERGTLHMNGEEEIGSRGSGYSSWPFWLFILVLVAISIAIAPAGCDSYNATLDQHSVPDQPRSEMSADQDRTVVNSEEAAVQLPAITVVSGQLSESFREHNLGDNRAALFYGVLVNTELCASGEICCGPKYSLTSPHN